MAPVTRSNKKQKPVKSITTLVKAVKQVKVHKQSIRSVSKAHNIPLKSLSRYVARVSEKTPDITAVDDNTLQEALKKIVKKISVFFV